MLRSVARPLIVLRCLRWLLGCSCEFFSTFTSRLQIHQSPVLFLYFQSLGVSLDSCSSLYSLSMTLFHCVAHFFLSVGGEADSPPAHLTKTFHWPTC